MAWPFPETSFADGEFVTPHEFNANWRSLLTQINGNIDRDNVWYQDLLAPNIAVNEMVQRYTATANTLTFSQSAAATGPLIATLASVEAYTDEGQLQLSGQADLVRDATALGWYARSSLGLTVNGALVAQRLPVRGSKHDAASVRRNVLVAAGYHTVALVLVINEPYRGGATPTPINVLVSHARVDAVHWRR